MAFAAPVVRGHHERWDGGGYPDGLAGDAIPLLSRVIATCDVFVSMASDRPHRRGMGAETALEQVSHGRGSQFDPTVVDALVAALRGRTSSPAAGGVAGAGTATRHKSSPRHLDGARMGLAGAIDALDVVPAFAPVDRVLSATEAEGQEGPKLIAAIESDTGLTIAILRRAQDVAAAPDRECGGCRGCAEPG